MNDNWLEYLIVGAMGLAGVFQLIEAVKARKQHAIVL
jgi:hypothetical protein